MAFAQLPDVPIDTTAELTDAALRLVALDSGHLTSNGSLIDVVNGAPALELETSVFQDENGRVYYFVEGPREVVEASSWEWDALAGGQVVSETSLVGTSPQPSPPWVYETPNGSLLTLDEFPIDVDLGSVPTVANEVTALSHSRPSTTSPPLRQPTSEIRTTQGSAPDVVPDS